MAGTEAGCGSEATLETCIPQFSQNADPGALNAPQFGHCTEIAEAAALGWYWAGTDPETPAGAG